MTDGAPGGFRLTAVGRGSMTRRRAAGRIIAIGLLAAIAFVACGGNDGNRPPIALPTTTERTTTTRAPVTSTTNAPVTSTTNASSASSTTTTEQPTTTTARATTTSEAATTTTEPATTTTEPEPTTTTEVEESTTSTAVAAPQTVPVAETVEPTGDTVWPWVVLLLLVIAAIVALIVSHRRGNKASATSWVEQVDRAVADGRVISDELRQGGAGPEAEPALGRRLRTLDATLVSLQARSPSDADRTAITDARRAIAELVVAIDGDVRLRIGPPPPTQEQLSTSRALINQQALDLNDTLDRLATAIRARS